MAPNFAFEWQRKEAIVKVITERLLLKMRVLPKMLYRKTSLLRQNFISFVRCSNVRVPADG